MLYAVTYSVLVFQDLMEYRPFFLFNAFVHTEFKFNYLMQKYLQSCRKDTNTLHINKHLCSFFLVKVPLARLIAVSRLVKSCGAAVKATEWRLKSRGCGAELNSQLTISSGAAG